MGSGEGGQSDALNLLMWHVRWGTRCLSAVLCAKIETMQLIIATTCLRLISYYHIHCLTKPGNPTTIVLQRIF